LARNDRNEAKNANRYDNWVISINPNNTTSSLLGGREKIVINSS
jgi:hypothetical protein